MWTLRQDMFFKIQNCLYKLLYIIKSKFTFPGLLSKIFSKSNLNKVIIIFVIGFISRAFICYIYGINVYIEYLNKISIIYYIIMALFVVMTSEIVSYFEFSLIPPFISNYCFFIYSLTIKMFSLTWKSLLALSESISFINKRIHSLMFHYCVFYKDIKLSSITLWVRNMFYCINDRDKLTVGIKEDLTKNKVLLEDGKSKNIKINNVFHKGNENGEKLLPKTYNPNKVVESNDEVITVNSNNPSRSGSIPASEIGFPSNPSQAVRIGEDFLLTSQDRNVQDLTDNCVSKTGKDFYLYDRSASENSSFRTPSTMTPLFGDLPTPPQENYINCTESSRNSVEYRSNYRPYVDSTGASNYPVPLVIRNKVIKPSEMWSRLPLANQNKHILCTDSSPNLSKYSVAIPSESVYSRSIGLTRNFNDGIKVSSVVRNSENAVLSNNPISSHRASSSNNPVSPNYKSKHMKNINYVEAREGVLAKMREKYAKGNLELHYNEVVVIDDKKMGKVKLGFSDFGGRFNNGVRKIKSLYIKYEGIGKRKVYWNVFEAGTNNYESYADFKKSWDSKKGLWKSIKDRVKTDLKRDIEELLGIRTNTDAIGNRPIDNLIEQRRAYERLKVRNAKLRANNPIIASNEARTGVANVQEESNEVHDKGIRKRKYRHSHGHYHGRSHHRSRRT